LRALQGFVPAAEVRRVMRPTAQQLCRSARRAFLSFAKVTQEKAAPLSAFLRFAAGNLGWVYWVRAQIRRAIRLARRVWREAPQRGFGVLPNGCLTPITHARTIILARAVSGKKMQIELRSG